MFPSVYQNLQKKVKTGIADYIVQYQFISSVANREGGDKVQFISLVPKVLN